MKKLAVFIGILVLIIAAGGLGASHYRNELFDAAIAAEAQKAGLSERTVNVGDMVISYYEGPKKANQETVVLIHGFGAIKENWLRFSAFLTNDYHVIAFDLPGHGKSSQEFSRSYTIDAQVENVRNITAALGVQRFHLAGNSMGGAISSMYAARYPESLQSLTLIDPAGIYDHYAPLQEALEQGKNPLIVKNMEEFHYLIDFAMEKPPIIPWPLINVAADRAMAMQGIKEKIFADIRQEGETDFKAELGKIRTPTLIMWGDQDRIIDVGNAAVFKALIPHAQLDIYEGIGHVPMMEIPEQSATDMRNFMSQSR